MPAEGLGATAGSLQAPAPGRLREIAGSAQTVSSGDKGTSTECPGEE